MTLTSPSSLYKNCPSVFVIYAKVHTPGIAPRTAHISCRAHCQKTTSIFHGQATSNVLAVGGNAGHCCRIPSRSFPRGSSLLLWVPLLESGTRRTCLPLWEERGIWFLRIDHLQLRCMISILLHVPVYIDSSLGVHCPFSPIPQTFARVPSCMRGEAEGAGNQGGW
jgi:hypothetical protein